MASLRQMSCLKITFQYLKKADQMAKRIPWGMFHVEGPGQVVICIFSRSTSCFHVCWAYILAYCRSHIIARLCDLVRNNFFSFKAAQNDSDVLVNIFQYPGHMNKLPDVVMSLIQTSLFLSHVALGWCTVCYVLCCTWFRHSLLSCVVLDIGDCYVSYTCNARPVLLYPLSCHFFLLCLYAYSSDLFMTTSCENKRMMTGWSSITLLWCKKHSCLCLKKRSYQALHPHHLSL